MFDILGAGLQYISDPYWAIYQIIATDITGAETILSSSYIQIYADIQNVGDGEQLELGREGSIGYKRIIVLTENELGLDDPVYENGIEGRYIVIWNRRYYRVMLEGEVQPDGYFRYHADLMDYLNGIPTGFIFNVSQLSIGTL